jgi:hypothetical protein
MPIPAAAPAAPAAAVPAAPAAAPAASDSILPAAPAASPAPAAPVVAPAAAPQPTAVDPNAPAPWNYADGTPGTGKAPDWFKADKYKTVDKQAEAYSHLEKRFGTFVGAPEGGKYEFKAPEGLDVTLDNEHPLLVDLNKWGVENQLSQKGYNELMGMLSQYEAGMIPDMNEVKKEIGDHADDRIANVATWAQANLGAEGYQTLRAALSGQQAAAIFTSIEAIIGKTTQVPMPKPGSDSPAAQPGGEAAILAKFSAKDANGRLRTRTDLKYLAEVEAELRKFYNDNQSAA